MDFAYVNREAGVYRFVFEVAYDSLGRHLIPCDQSSSAPFELTP